MTFFKHVNPIKMFNFRNSSMSFFFFSFGHFLSEFSQACVKFMRKHFTTYQIMEFLASSLILCLYGNKSKMLESTTSVYLFDSSSSQILKIPSRTSFYFWWTYSKNIRKMQLVWIGNDQVNHYVRIVIMLSIVIGMNIYYLALFIYLFFY